MEETAPQGVDEVEHSAQNMVLVRVPSRRERILMVLAVIATFAVYAVAFWSIGYQTAQSDSTHSEFIATVAGIDPGADTSHYQNLRVGSRITLTLDWTSLDTFQKNGPGMTLCTSDGLAINSYESPDEQTVGVCDGPRIHVVLFPSSQLVIPPPPSA